jgi:hypothetical protein
MTLVDAPTPQATCRLELNEEVFVGVVMVVVVVVEIEKWGHQ